MQFLQQLQLGALTGCFANQLFGFLLVGLKVSAVGLLDHGYAHRGLLLIR